MYKEQCSQTEGETPRSLYCTGIKAFPDYDFSNTIYNMDSGYVTYICPEHGEVTQRVSSLLRGCGCNKCGNNTIRKKQVDKAANSFMNKAIAVHGGLYAYDRFTYTTAKTQGTITCRIHGDFLQAPDKHLSGHGCPECGKVSLYAWHTACKVRLYILYFPVVDQYKIGVTKYSVAKRYSNIPETYHVIFDVLYENGATAYAIEQYLLKLYTAHKVLVPTILIGNGSSELVHKLPEGYLLDIDKAYIETKELVNLRTADQPNN